MLVALGKRTAPEGVVELLSDCHARIRRFLVLARCLATTPGIPDDEVRDVAAQIRRYFTLSFPLHLADEEHTIAPRLAGRDVDEAVARMRADHVGHAGVVGRLLALCEELEREPGTLPRRGAELAEVTACLAPILEEHLKLEERVLFPILRDLPRSEQDAIRNEMRARRENAHSLRV